MITAIKYLNAIVIIFLYITVAIIIGIIIFPVITIIELILFIIDYIAGTDDYDHAVFIQYLNSIKDYIKTMWYKLTY